MKRPAAVDLALGAAASAVVLYGFWRAFGSFGLVYGMPVLAVCAMPLLELFSAFPRLAGHHALRRDHGRRQAYRGHQVDIDIDAQATCWVGTAGVRRILPSLPGEGVLQRLQPGQVMETGAPRLWRITPAALAGVLGRSADAAALKFRRWLGSQVQDPARRRLERGMPIR